MVGRVDVKPLPDSGGTPDDRIVLLSSATSWTLLINHTHVNCREGLLSWTPSHVGENDQNTCLNESASDGEVDRNVPQTVQNRGSPLTPQTCYAEKCLCCRPPDRTLSKLNPVQAPPRYKCQVTFYVLCSIFFSRLPSVAFPQISTGIRPAI